MRTCHCCTGPTARSSPSATAPHRCRSCAKRATCRRRRAITSLYSAGARATTPPSSRQSPARFDEVKLRWLDGIYIRGLSVGELADRVLAYLRISDPQAASAAETDRQLLEGAVAISQEKIQTLADFWPLSRFFFTGVAEDAAARERWLDERGSTFLSDARAQLSSAPSFEVEAVQAALAQVIDRHEAKPREVYQPVRVAIAGTTVSPGIFESVALLGREETLRRIDLALAG
jgi:glutamyl-tRNA synthetase